MNKKLKIEIALINIIVLSLFIIIFKNYIDKTNKFINIKEKYDSSEILDSLSDDSPEIELYVRDDFPKYQFSKYLTSNSNYWILSDRNCVITGSKADRHRVRWVIRYIEFKIFDGLIKIRKDLPYYFYIMIFGFLIWLGFFLCMQTTGYSWKNACIYLFSIAFIFQHQLSEVNFSIIEMAMLALAMWASKKRKVLIFIAAVIIATLNRESGPMIMLIWLVFNKDYKIPFLTVLLSIITLLFVNFDIVECFFKPEFFLPTTKEIGQFYLLDVGGSSSYVHFFRVITNNFLLPLGLSVYFFTDLKNKSNPLFYIICFYYMIFFLATPLHHISIKMLTIPMIVLLGNPELLDNKLRYNNFFGKQTANLKNIEG